MTVAASPPTIASGSSITPLVDGRITAIRPVVCEPLSPGSRLDLRANRTAYFSQGIGSNAQETIA